MCPYLNLQLIFCIHKNIEELKKIFLSNKYLSLFKEHTEARLERYLCFLLQVLTLTLK